MRILSFSYCYPNHANPNWGVFVHQRLAAIAKSEELKVCAPVPWFPAVTRRRGDPGPEKDTWRGLTVYRPRFFYFPGILKNQDANLYFRGVRKWFHQLIHDWRPDVLDAHFVWPDGVAVAALGKEAGIPYTITLRGKLYECLKSTSKTRQCADALTDAAGVISVSGLLAEEARKLGVSSEKLSVIPNGVDRERFHPKDKATCRKELSLPPNGRIFVTVAHLGHRKGHHEVIHALAQLPEDVRLVIVGGPAQGGTFETIRSVAAKKGVENRLILTGPQPYHKIPLYFNAADASVLASYREGCPNAVLESLACGTPVVATDVGAVRDILTEPEVGRIVPPREVEPLRDALADVLKKDWDPGSVVRSSGVRSWDEVAAEVRTILRAALER